MNKKILSSVVVLSGFLFGGDVFAADTINIAGEGICEMALPANAMKKENNFEFSAGKEMFFNDDDEYVGFDYLLKKIREVLPDAIITSYKYDAYNEVMLFNIDTKLQKDLVGLLKEVDLVRVRNYNDKDISEDLTDEFTSSKEYLDCRDMAIKSAMKNAMDKAKILKVKIVYSPNYGYDKVYKIEDGKIRYYSDMMYRAVAD